MEPRCSRCGEQAVECDGQSVCQGCGFVISEGSFVAETGAEGQQLGQHVNANGRVSGELAPAACTLVCLLELYTCGVLLYNRCYTECRRLREEWLPLGPGQQNFAAAVSSELFELRLQHTMRTFIDP